MTQKIKTALAKFLTGRVCVFGFGNRMWSDDGAGSCLAEALADCPALESVDGDFVPENHLETVIARAANTIVLVDTTDFGGAPGEMKLLLPDEIAVTGLSTHAGSPRILSQYLQIRSRAKVALLAIQPGSTAEGKELSPEVAQSVSYLIKTLPKLCEGH